MLNFTQYQKYLEEKLIMFNNGASYGQVVFLAGGAGSGKGFTISNFMEGDKFKVRDVDEWKKISQKLSDISKKYKPSSIVKKYGDKFSDKDIKIIQSELIKPKKTLKDLDLRNPQHVYLLHILVDALKIKDKTLDMMLKDSSRKSKKGILDNIIFDITAKDIKSIEKVIPALLDAGYEEKNIHMVWVLTNYEVAVQQNAKRDRVVPADILLQTHEGAALTMNKITRNGYVPKGMDGGVYVVLGGAKNTIVFKDSDRNAKSKEELKKNNGDGEAIKQTKQVKDKGEKTVVVKDFNYLQLKKPGKGIVTNDIKINAQLYQWLINNIPKSTKTKDIW